jgi:hypothetical protein
MSCLIQAGQNFNLFANSLYTVTPSPAADTLFPIARLYDAVPGNIFRFGSLTASPTVTVDFTDGMGGFGGLNAWTGGTPDGFTETTSGGGTVTQDNVNKQEGASSALFTPGAGGSCTLYRDVTVRSGFYYKLSAYGINNATGILAINVYIQNLTTGRYWNGGAATSWSSVQAAGIIMAQDLVWTQASGTFQVEGYGACRAETVTLRITFSASSSTETCNLDLIEFYPAVDFISIHGHNIDDLIEVTLQSSTDGFSSVVTTEATLTQRVGAFYGVLAARVYRRYWRLRFLGTNTSASGAIYLGEAVLSQAFALSKAPAYPVRLRFRTPQIRTPLQWGAGGIYGVSRHPTIGMGLDWKQEEAHFTEFFHEVFMRSMGGAAMVVVPDTNDPLGITYARFPESYDVSRVMTTFRELGSIDLEPLPLPMLIG